MKLKELVGMFGSRKKCAEDSGISYQHLSNKLSENPDVLKLADGRHIVVRKDSIFIAKIPQDKG